MLFAQSVRNSAAAWAPWVLPAARAEELRAAWAPSTASNCTEQTPPSRAWLCLRSAAPGPPRLRDQGILRRDDFVLAGTAEAARWRWLPVAPRPAQGHDGLCVRWARLTTSGLASNLP